MLNKTFLILILQAILQALKAATVGRTSICIAHRLSTVADADEILVLENGSISERGRHSDLINNKSSLYYRLWEKQNRDANSIPKVWTCRNKYLVQCLMRIFDPVTVRIKCQYEQRSLKDILVCFKIIYSYIIWKSILK